MRLFEYMLHPFNVMQGIYKYNRNLEVKGRKRRIDVPKSENPWVSHNFSDMYDDNRINLYATYYEMDRDPMIGKVLDTFAKTCIQPNSEGRRQDAGRTVWCQSSNEEVYKIVTNFLDMVEMEEFPFETMRNMFHYGDSFEGLPGARNVGIVRLDPYDPWQIGTVEDEDRQVKGFGQADDKGYVTNMETVVPYWEFAHFRIPRRRRTNQYGAMSSILYNVREYWQDLQWVMDKIVIQRLWMLPQRLLINLDIGGMSSEDAFDMCEEYRQRLYREVYSDPATQEIHTMPTAWGEFRDIVLPKGADNATSIQVAPQSSVGSPFDDLEFFLKRFFGGMAFPPGYLGLDIGGNYDPSTPIEKQDVAFSQSCMGPQRSFLRTLTRMAMVHMAYLGVDPRLEKNQFVLMMTPVSFVRELERKEILDMRFDLLSRALDMGRDAGWNMKYWIRYVMREYGLMEEKLIDKLLETEVEETPAGEEEFALESKYQDVIDVLESSPKALEAIQFFGGGAAMMRSHPLYLRDITFVESEENKLGSVYFKDEQFQERMKKRLDERRKNRKDFFVGSIHGLATARAIR